MVEWVNTAVPVEVQILADGTARPIAFFWEQRRFSIVAWGRTRHGVPNGEEVDCHLVQTDGPETWELCYHKKTAQWTMVRHWAGRSRIL